MSDGSLGALANPENFHGPSDVAGQDASAILAHLEQMLRIRLAERCLADGKRENVIGGPVHLGVGQEAVAVGVSAHLHKGDRVFGGHRSHSHVLALGADGRRLFAEILGKETGLSRGMGGPRHLWDGPIGFYGSVPIVSGTVALAVGAALAAKLQGSDSVGVSYIGDGAVEEGVVHESLNLARMLEAGEDPMFVARRLVILSSEDVGLADPNALPIAVAAQQATHALGMPEALFPLTEATIYLALAPKSNSGLRAYGAAKAAVDERGALPVPLHLRNAATNLMRRLGYGEGYRYAHDFPGAKVEQQHLPDELKQSKFYEPGEVGWEADD